MEEVSDQDLRWFFQQWIHTTATLDYGLGEVSINAVPDGGWETTAEIIRTGDAWMPVRVRVGSEVRTLDSRDRIQTVRVRTTARPDAVTIDPDNILIDIDPSNNTRQLR